MGYFRAIDPDIANRSADNAIRADDLKSARIAIMLVDLEIVCAREWGKPG